jgi:MSHA pilin protein MshC
VRSTESTRARAAADEAGFTLVELVVALAVIAVLAAVAAPRFVSVSEMNADLFRTELLAAVRYARRLAVASGCGVQIEIAASSYALTQQVGCTGSVWTQAVVDPSTAATTYVRAAPSGVLLASTVNPVRFDPLGRATDSSGAVVSPTVSVGGRTISVVGESGFAQAN